MRVSVQLFAVARDRVGQAMIDLELSEGANVATLRQQIIARYPQLRDIVPRAMIAINADYASDDAVINQEHEIAIIPPVSGG